MKLIKFQLMRNMNYRTLFSSVGSNSTNPSVIGDTAAGKDDRRRVTCLSNSDLHWFFTRSLLSSACSLCRLVPSGRSVHVFTEVTPGTITSDSVSVTPGFDRLRTTTEEGIVKAGFVIEGPSGKLAHVLTEVTALTFISDEVLVELTSSGSIFGGTFSEVGERAGTFELSFKTVPAPA